MIRIVDSFGVHISATIDGHTFLTVYAGRARSADVSAHRAALERFIDSRGTPVPVLTVISEGSTVGARGRKEISRMLADLDRKISAWAVVMEGAGFWLSAARVIAGGVRLVSGSSCPFKIASSVREAVGWLEQQRGPSPGGGSYPPRLTDEIAELERKIRSAT